MKSNYQQAHDTSFAQSIKNWAGHLTDAQIDSLAALINPRRVKAKRLPCPEDLHFGCTFPYTVSSLPILQKIHSMKFPRVLDVACGFGSFTYLAAIAGANAIGVDINTAAIAEAKNDIKKFSPFISGKTDFFEADTLAFDREIFKTKYDMIHCRKFMHFLPPNMQIQLLQNLYSMLEEGGILYVSANSIHSGDPNRRVLAEKRYDAGDKHPGYIGFSRLDDSVECKAIPKSANYEPGVLYNGTIENPIRADSTSHEPLIYMTNMLDHRTFKNSLSAAGIPQENTELFYESWNIYEPAILPAENAMICPNTPYNLLIEIVKN